MPRLKDQYNPLPFNVVHVSDNKFAVNKGVIINPTTLEINRPKVEDSDLTNLSTDEFPTLEVEIEENEEISLQINHDNFFVNSSKIVNKTKTEIEEEDHEDSVAVLKLATVTFDSDNIPTVRQIVNSNVVFGSGGDSCDPMPFTHKIVNGEETEDNPIKIGIYWGEVWGTDGIHAAWLEGMGQQLVEDTFQDLIIETYSGQYVITYIELEVDDGPDNGEIIVPDSVFIKYVDGLVPPTSINPQIKRFPLGLLEFEDDILVSADSFINQHIQIIRLGDAVDELSAKFWDYYPVTNHPFPHIDYVDTPESLP